MRFPKLKFFKQCVINKGIFCQTQICYFPWLQNGLNINHPRPFFAEVHWKQC
jgi:hypothetical protein